MLVALSFSPITESAEIASERVILLSSSNQHVRTKEAA